MHTWKQIITHYLIFTYTIDRVIYDVNDVCSAMSLYDKIIFDRSSVVPCLYHNTIQYICAILTIQSIILS